MKILIIDDEDDFRSVLTDRLVHAGYEVIEANNGSVGVDIARSQKPDLVLLDIMMPLMNGHQCWAAFHRDEDLKKIPILILTAKMHASDVFFRGAFPEEDYLSKSSNYNNILDRVKAKLDDQGEFQRQLREYL